MVSFSCSPLTFLLTGFTWLMLSALLGMAILLGLVYGTPLPSWLRVVHVHGVLIGGLLQLMIGGLLASLAHASESKHALSGSRPLLFFTLNGATIALLICLGLKQYPLAGVIGLLLTGVIALLAKPLWEHAQEHLAGPTNAAWIYGAALAALFVGLAVGVGMAFRLLPEYYAHARLLHLHLILLGFFTVMGIALTQRLLPAILRCELANRKMGRLTTGLLFAGFAALLGGFVTSSLRFELAVGSLLVVSVVLYAVNLFQTWLTSGSAGNAASDHLLIGIIFLVLVTGTGILMGANFLPDPPMLPMGSLHLAAYTHLAFIGFLVNIVCGALSYGLPAFLAASRVSSAKKRGPYREQLDAVMNRWRSVQLVGISFGTMGIAVIATLTWSVSLSSLSVLVSTWVTAGLLLAGLTLFSAKLAWVAGLRRPEHPPST